MTDHPAGRIARNTGVQVAGEVAGKLASFALYVVMARALGQSGFGDFTFALSLSLLLTTIAGLGTDPIVTREIARERDARHPVFWNAVAVKLAFGTAAIGVALGVVTLGGYDDVTRAAVAVLSVATVLELLAKTVFAAFQGVDDMRPVAAALLLQRLVTAGLGIAALLLGAGVLAVCGLYLLGSVLALAWGASRLFARVGRPLVAVSRARARDLAVQSLPIGLSVIFSTVLFRVDATLLSLIKDNDAVALYGAAYRLLESTLFLSYAFVAAVLPTLSRSRRDTSPSAAETYEGALKVIVVALLPIGTSFVLFAQPLTDLLYGEEFSNAASALRLLGGATALYGVSYLSGYVLVSQGRQIVIPWVTGFVAIQNIVLNLVFIPRYSYDAAAATTTISEVTLAVLMTFFALRATGRVAAVRIAAGPVAGCAAMLVTWALVGDGLVGLIVAVPAYLGVLVAVERSFFPHDLRLLARLALRRPAAA